MSNAEPEGKTPRNVSYLRTKDPLEAVAVKAAISQFFGPVQESPTTPPRQPKVRHEPKHAMWIIGGGTSLVIAAVMSVAFRDQLPAAVPGFYLGLGGLAVIRDGSTISDGAMSGISA